MTAIAAVDTALWDLKAKAAGLPLYQLLGGKSRSGVMVYSHANGSDIEHTVDEVLRYADMGYRAIRAQSGVPGLDKVYGVGRGNLFYEPADSDLPSEHDWSTEVPAPRAQAVRAHPRKLGFEHHLLHGVHHRLTPIEAGRLGKSLEPYNLFWMEDATPAENQEAFRLIRQHTTTPLAVGEIFNNIWDCKDLVQNQLIDYIRTTVVHAGGIAPAPHRRPGLALPGAHGLPRRHRPVAGLHGAALRFDLWVPNFGIQEYMRHTEETDAVFPHAYTFRTACCIRATRRAGVEIDESWRPGIRTSAPLP